MAQMSQVDTAKEKQAVSIQVQRSLAAGILGLGHVSRTFLNYSAPTLHSPI